MLGAVGLSALEACDLGSFAFRVVRSSASAVGVWGLGVSVLEGISGVLQCIATGVAKHTLFPMSLAGQCTCIYLMSSHHVTADVRSRVELKDFGLRSQGRRTKIVSPKPITPYRRKAIMIHAEDALPQPLAVMSSGRLPAPKRLIPRSANSKSSSSGFRAQDAECRRAKTN